MSEARRVRARVLPFNRDAAGVLIVALRDECERLRAEVDRLRSALDDDRLLIASLQNDYERATAALHRVMAAKALQKEKRR